MNAGEKAVLGKTYRCTLFGFGGIAVRREESLNMPPILTIQFQEFGSTLRNYRGPEVQFELVEPREVHDHSEEGREEFVERQLKRLQEQDGENPLDRKRRLVRERDARERNQAQAASAKEIGDGEDQEETQAEQPAPGGHRPEGAARGE